MLFDKTRKESLTVSCEIKNNGNSMKGSELRGDIKLVKKKRFRCPPNGKRLGENPVE